MEIPKIEKSTTYSIENDLKFFSKLNILFHSVDVSAEKDTNGEPMLKPDGRIYKTWSPRHKYTVLTKSVILPNKNGTIVPTGRKNKFIGIDVDKKGDSLKLFEEFEKSSQHFPDTLTIKTCHGGFHLYYRLTDEQFNYLIRSMVLFSHVKMVFYTKIGVYLWT